MRIAQLAPLTESVPPQTYGGTELVVQLLTEGLIAAGHEVTLFASGDSVTGAELVAGCPRALRLDESVPMRRWPAYALKQLLEFEKRQNEFDLVHNHMGYEAFAALRRTKCPSITTNHNPIKDYCAPLYFAYSDLNYVCISDAYKKLNYPDEINYVATVHNGIDIGPYALNRSSHKRSYLLFIGRICHDKGTAEAIEIAQQIGLPLKIAGKVDTADKEYFQSLVSPHLSAPEIEYLGEVDYQQKLALYKDAIAVVYPIAFDEPFGLVIAESIASGTPVLALERGSVPELIKDGITGVVAKTPAELVRRFSEIENISGDTCRNYARDHFSKEKMVSEYLRTYEVICQSKQLLIS